jgi:molybdopterin-dependent oxidoreductase alpha subunit
MKPMTSGGGWAAIRHTLRMANRIGWRRLWQALRTRNACKTCALGMGGQHGGMRNEAGHWPEVCKKSLQALIGDMQGAVRPAFFRKYGFAELRGLGPRELEACGRLTEPLYAGPGDGHYDPIGWDEALAKVAGHLRAGTPDQHFFYASGRSSNEAGFLLQLLARLHGTNYVNNCSYYCHQASGVGLGAALGTGTATVVLDDVEHADLFFLIGGNPASNHPRLMRSLMLLRRRGGRVVVINPVREVGLVNFRVPSDLRSLLFGSAIASLYVQPHIGGDIALLTGVAKAVLERQGEDTAFLAAATEGHEAFRRHVAGLSWEALEAGSGVGRTAMAEIADLYSRAKNVVFGWAMGITQHAHGVANVQTIVNLALLRGMVGRPGAGLLPLRGHSNVQGIGSMGVSPALKQAVLNRLEAHLGVPLPKAPGLDTMGCMQVADRGEMRAALCLGGNLFGSNPDARFAARALGKLELVAYLSTALNTGHVWGRARETLVLPVLARDEECQKTTQESMFNYVRLSDGGRPRHEGPRGEVAIIAALAGLVLGERSPVDWKALQEHRSIRRMIAQIVPGYEAVGAIDDTGREFQVGGRTFHTPRFATPSGKARFTVHPLPPRDLADGQLRLMTVRSEGQFNTVVYEEEDIYRGQERRDIILMNGGDIDRLGLRVNQRVTVRSEVGALPHVLVRRHDIRAGNALMYFPEANVLVPTTTDPASKTPAFKAVAITIERESPAGSGPGAEQFIPAEELRRPRAKIEAGRGA